MREPEIQVAYKAAEDMARVMKWLVDQAGTIDAPAFPIKGNASEAEMLKAFGRWIASVQQVTDATQKLSKGLARVLSERKRLASAMKKMEAILEGKNILKDPKNSFARKAYEASVVAEAVKHGLVLGDE